MADLYTSPNIYVNNKMKMEAQARWTTPVYPRNITSNIQKASDTGYVFPQLRREPRQSGVFWPRYATLIVSTPPQNSSPIVTRLRTSQLPSYHAYTQAESYPSTPPQKRNPIVARPHTSLDLR